MNPKEKATAIFNTLYSHKWQELKSTRKLVITSMPKSVAIWCAMMMVDEIIATDTLVDEDIYIETPTYLQYWIDVKNELRKM